MNSHSERHVVVHATVVLLLIVASGFVHADCEWSDRIDMDSAECLTGEWTNRTWPAKDTAEVKNECSTLGTVVAKVDREGAADWTKWLENREIHSMSGAYGNIRGIHCCSDLSDLCNKKDIVNVDNCIASFWESPASEEPEGVGQYERRSCTSPRATVSVADETCSLTLVCSYWRDVGFRKAKTIVNRSITAHINDVSTIELSTDGELSVPQ